MATIEGIKGWYWQWQNRPVVQIPQWTSPVSHSAPFCNRNVHMWAHFCCKMVHCGIFVWCIVELVRWVYCRWGLCHKTSLMWEERFHGIESSCEYWDASQNVPGDCFTNNHELLHLTLLNLYKMCIFQCMGIGQDILYVCFEIYTK